MDPRDRDRGFGHDTVRSQTYEGVYGTHDSETTPKLLFEHRILIDCQIRDASWRTVLRLLPFGLTAYLLQHCQERPSDSIPRQVGSIKSLKQQLSVNSGNLIVSPCSQSSGESSQHLLKQQASGTLNPLSKTWSVRLIFFVRKIISPPVASV